MESMEKYFISTKFYIHKFVNILSVISNSYGNFHFYLLFEKSEEVNMVKIFVSDFTKI